MSNNLEKELEMYFYNEGYGSGKEATDMAAFLQKHERKETNLFNNITDKIMTILFILLLFVGLGIGISYLGFLVLALLKIGGNVWQL